MLFRSVVISSRIIKSLDVILAELKEDLNPVNETLYTANVVDEFEPVRTAARKHLARLRKLNSLVLNINMITKKLWRLNREYVLRISEDPSYFEDIESLIALIEELPKNFKKEAQQRLITPAIRKQKMEQYRQLKDMLLELKKNFSDQDRALLLPYNSIDSKSLDW